MGINQVSNKKIKHAKALRKQAFHAILTSSNNILC